MTAGHDTATEELALRTACGRTLVDKVRSSLSLLGDTFKTNLQGEKWSHEESQMRVQASLDLTPPLRQTLFHTRILPAVASEGCSERRFRIDVDTQC